MCGPTYLHPRQDGTTVNVVVGQGGELGEVGGQHLGNTLGTARDSRTPLQLEINAKMYPPGTTFF